MTLRFTTFLSFLAIFLLAGCSGATNLRRTLIMPVNRTSDATAALTVVDTALTERRYKAAPAIGSPPVIHHEETFLPLFSYSKDSRFFVTYRAASGSVIIVSCLTYVPPFQWGLPKDFSCTREELLIQLSRLPGTMVVDLPDVQYVELKSGGAPDSPPMKRQY